MLLIPAALAAPGPADPVLARLSERLRQAWSGGEAREQFRHATIEPAEMDGVSVVIEGDVDADALRDAGWDVQAAAGDRVQVWADYEDLPRLAAVPGVTRVREPERAEPKRETEGYAAILAQDWHEQGIDGSGVRIGIVDVGFARMDAVGDAEVPRDRITDFTRGEYESTPHGTAVTEVIYDFAPGARFWLACFSTEVEFAEALDWLGDQDVDVVNGSIGFDNNAHADGWSFVTRQVEDLVDRGVIYTAAAGNENDKYRVGDLNVRDGEIQLAGVGEVRANTASGFARVSLRWSEPFGAAATDLDLLLLNEDGSECGRSGEPQDGDDDPYEIVYASGCSDVVTVKIIGGVEGVDPHGLEGYLYDPYSLEEAYWTGTEDLTLPGDTEHGISVGAWYVDEGALPWYSSRGPTNDGRMKPDVVAPTAVSTATYGRGLFEGSSASAPHVAGLAALWVDASGKRDPEAFKEWLLAGATDVGEEGSDLATGAGLVHAGAPPEGCGCGSPAAPAWGMIGVAAVLARRRR